MEGKEKYRGTNMKVDIRKQVAIHIAQINELDKSWTKQVWTYDKGIKALKEDLKQQNDKHQLEIWQIQIGIEESRKLRKQSRLLTPVQHLETSVLAIQDTLKKRDKGRQSWLETEQITLKKRLEKQFNWVDTEQETLWEFSEESKLRKENEKGQKHLDELEWKFFEYDKRVKGDLQRLKRELDKLNMKELEDIKGLRKELKNYLKEISIQQKWLGMQKLEIEYREIDKPRKLNKHPGALSSEDGSQGSDKGDTLLNKEPSSSSRNTSSIDVDLNSNLKPKSTNMEKVWQPTTQEGSSYLAFDKNLEEFAKQLAKLGLYLHDIL